MKCPGCGEKTRVTETRDTGDVVYRTRRCDACEWLVTTKEGAEGPATISVRYECSMSQSTKNVELADIGEWRRTGKTRNERKVEGNGWFGDDIYEYEAQKRGKLADSGVELRQRRDGCR